MRNALPNATQSQQLPLPLPLDRREESILRTAHRSAGLSMPFEVAMSVPALAICLRCLGEAGQKRRLRAQALAPAAARKPRPSLQQLSLAAAGR